MRRVFVFPPAYYPQWVTPQPQPPRVDPSLDILDQLSDDKLKELEQAYLGGEDVQLATLPFAVRPAVEVLIALSRRLSACGSLRKTTNSHTVGTCVQHAQGMEPIIMPGVTTNLQGHQHSLSPGVQDFLDSSEHHAALQDAIKNGPDYLASNKLGICISDHIDFGLKRAGWPTDNGNLDPYRSGPQYFRTLTVVNTGGNPALLLDICGIPSLHRVFYLHDDYGLAHHLCQASDTPRCCTKRDLSKGVMLYSGAQYYITIELQCTPEDCSFHQQWLLFTFAQGCRTTSIQKEIDKESVFIVGRRVSALVVKHVEDVQTSPSLEAKPFYPLYLRKLFDEEPKFFTFADISPCRKFMDLYSKQPSARQNGHLSVWLSSFLNMENHLETNKEVMDTNPASLLPSSIKRDSNTEQIRPLATQCACYRSQLRQLVRLLALEESAMEHDIREHDLFNIHMECKNVLENQCIIKVPGLPENRPCLFVGDVVYVRWARMPNQECAALVLAVETQPVPQIIIKLSPEFLVPLIIPDVHRSDFVNRISRLSQELIHVRFMIDRLIFKVILIQLLEETGVGVSLPRAVLNSMHTALLKTARSTAKLLPCICLIAAKEGPDRPGTKIGTSTANGFLNSGSVRKDNGRKASNKSNFLLVNKNLNKEQQSAVKAVLYRDVGPGPYIIFGPPGTGKTVTVVECVLQVLKTVDEPLLCVCAPSNYAADILCSGISNEGGITPAQMWRLNDPRRPSSFVKADVKMFCTEECGVFNQFHPTHSTLKIVVCTCAAAAMLHEEPLISRLRQFTHIMIDEAGQALIPEALIPLSLASHDTCCVLCGDPRQLGPVVHSKLAAANGLARSLLEHFMLSPGYRLEVPVGQASLQIIKLLRNYRANSKLLELPSRLFYDDKLIASAEEQSVAPPKNWEEMNGFDFPMLFYGVKGQQMREGESPSYFNPVEITKLVDLITGLLEKTEVVAEDIGVMAPYRRQVQKLRLVLRARGLGAIRVGTVDDYQGQEQKIIFISTVLTRPETFTRAQAAGAPEQVIGFLSNAKRFNVAITRAKAMLVVVGHPVILSKDDNWRELLRYCFTRGAFRGYGSDRIPSYLPSSSVPLEDPFNDIEPLPLEAHADAESDVKEREEKNRAIEMIAEMSLLGMGHVETLYPDTLDSFYAANSEDQDWRVVL